MSLSLANRDDVVANSISLIQQTGLYDLGENLIDVVAALPSKVDKGTVYTTAETYNKPEVNALLANLSDATVPKGKHTTDVNTALALESNIIDVNNSLNLKADKSEVNAALALKADLTAVEAVQLGLATKADKTTTYTKTETNALLNDKANAADITTALALKADKTSVNSSVAVKADMAYVDDNLTLKANKTYVDSQLAQKASIGYVDQKVFDGVATVVNTAPLALDTLSELAAALNNDANYAATVQTQFGFKADKASTYAKAETDTFLTDKATVSDLALKANQSTTYTKTKTNNLLNQKAAVSDLDLKANTADTYTKTQINTMLATKTDDDEVYAAIGLKANTSDTYTKTQTNGLLDAKANKTDVDASLLLKANVSDVYSKVQIETKLAGTAQLDDVLTLFQLTDITGGHTIDLTSKANKTYVDEQLLLKANLTNVYNKTQVSNFLSDKANTLSVHTKTEMSGLLNAKANSIDVCNITDANNLLTTLGNSKANTADVYTITATNNLLALRAASSNVYTKPEMESILSSKVEVFDVCNKTDVDTKLGGKANIASVYTVTETDTLLGARALKNNPTFTSTVSGITKAMVGLSNVDNTSDLNKPISTLMQTALNLKADASSLTKAGIGLGNVDNTSDLNKPISTSAQTALNLKADLSSVNKIALGLGNVGNTSDLNKPISNSTQTALSAKVPWVYDSFLTLDAIQTYILRPKKVGQTHIKVDTDLAVVGNCNITNELVVGGRNVLNALNAVPSLTNPTITGNSTNTGQLYVDGADIITTLMNLQPLLGSPSPDTYDELQMLWTNNVIRNIKAGRNITLTGNDHTITIYGLSNGGGVITGVSYLINGAAKCIAALKGGSCITTTSDAVNNVFTIAAPDISTIQSSLSLKANSSDVYTTTTFDNMFAQKQKALLVNIPTTGVSIIDSNVVNGLNVNSPLSVSKANSLTPISSDTYSKSEVNTMINNTEPTLTPVLPLKKVYNVISGGNKLRIDPTSDMTINYMTVNGSLSTTGFYSAKPYIGFYFTSGMIALTIPGYTPRANITLATRSAGSLYSFTFPAHPFGGNYMVFAQPRTGSTGAAFFTCTTNVMSQTNFYVWCRSASNTIVDGDFYVYTVP